MRAAFFWSAVALSSGCAEGAPPGAAPSPSASTVVVVGVAGNAPEAPPSESARPAPRAELGSELDNLPFARTEERVASIAWRTWVYTDTGPKRTRFGYLRAGAVVPSRGPPIVNEGCPGGWLRVNPRGFVCVGKGATTEAEHPVVVAASVAPRRAEGLPYLYAMAKNPGPHFYFRLPSQSEMLAVEGPGYGGRMVEWKETAKRPEVAALLGDVVAPPDFLPRASGQSLVKPYGTEQSLHRSVHAGRSDPDAGFAVQRVFEWEQRAFGLTTELDVIPMDRTRLVVPSQFHGVALGPTGDLPAAIVNKRWALKYREAKPGLLKPVGTFGFREALALTGRTVTFEGVRFWEGTGGDFVPLSSALILEKRGTFPSVAEGNRKWIDVSIRDQSLVAYEGNRAVYVTLVSTGLAGLADPEKAPATVRGTYMIHTKHVSATMDGSEDVADSYSLRDVPFVQYFHKGYALHAAYWHDEFGKMRSHGCINLSPIDAAWLFEWTDPEVPQGWHGVINKERGTAIIVRP